MLRGKGGVGVLSDADTDMRQQLEWVLDQDSAGKILDGSRPCACL